MLVLLLFFLLFAPLISGALMPACVLQFQEMPSDREKKDEKKWSRMADQSEQSNVELL